MTTRGRYPELTAATEWQDPVGFADLVRPHMTPLVRLAARLTSDAAADDVVQEALIRAWRHRRQYDPRLGSLLGWLSKIVVNEARRASRRKTPLSAWVTSAGISTASDDTIDLQLAIRTLTPRQQLAIACFYYAGLSVNETAVAMRCSGGTVKSTLADARAKLRRVLGGKDAG